MSTNERKTSRPLVVEGKLSDAERMKVESNYLRGTIAEDLNDGLTGGFKGDNFLLIRFHGMYQQDDRDIRAERAEQKLEPRHAMLLRCRLPGGIITTKQWQAIDKFAGENTIYGSIRLTNRQTFQFHGILKKNVKPVHQMRCTPWSLDALATANDMNRNVLCSSNPYESGAARRSVRVGEEDLRAPAATHPCLCGDLARSGESRDHGRRADPRSDLPAA